MARAISDLPKYLVLAPAANVRIDFELETPSCEIDLELDNPAPGRSFVLLVGSPGGPFVQRVRLSGRARVFFDPAAPGTYELLLANPHSEPIVVHLKGRGLDLRPGAPGRAPRPTVVRKGAGASVALRRHRATTRRRPRSEHRPG